jgi:hypothetical protein
MKKVFLVLISTKLHVNLGGCWLTLIHGPGKDPKISLPFCPNQGIAESKSNISQVKWVGRGHIRVIHKVTLSSPCLSPLILSFSGIYKVKTFLLNLSIKCCNSIWKMLKLSISCTRSGSKLITVVVQFGAILSFSGIYKVKTFLLNLSIKCCNSIWKMLKLSISCTRFETNYCSCTVWSYPLFQWYL